MTWSDSGRSPFKASKESRASWFSRIPTVIKPEIRNLHPDAETEAIAMRVAIEFEEAQGRKVTDVHEKNLGYDITSLDSQSGELRLIEIKGIGADEGTVALTPNEKRTAEDRRDCYWLYVVTRCKQPDGPKLMPVRDPAQLEWDEIRKIDHYALKVREMSEIGRPKEDVH